MNRSRRRRITPASGCGSAEHSGQREPCLFWLDGHYSAGITAKGEKETPIWEELEHICDHPIKNHVILIDDASLFVGKNDYPNLDSLQKFVESRFPDNIFEVRDDMIRIYK